MSAFSEEQQKELERFVNAADRGAGVAANAYANARIAAAITEERKRLADLIESFEPFSDTEHDDVLVPKGEIVDWGKTLKALADAIRSGRHG